MHYVSAEGLAKSYGIKPLFDGISFHIEEGDKVALVARNGSGKSTLLRILAGRETPDEGKLWISKDVDVVLFEQEPTFIENRSVLDNIFFHDHPVMNAIKEYELLSAKNNVRLSMTENGDPYENALAERMNRTIKEEFGMDRILKTKKQVEALVEQSIFLYNQKRPHLALNMQTPEQVHKTKIPAT